MITISRNKLKEILHAATGNVKDFVTAEDQFINEWLEHNPDVSDSNSCLSGVSESRNRIISTSCKICGGEIQLIRANHPHGHARIACTACAVEKYEDLKEQTRLQKQIPAADSH